MLNLTDEQKAVIDEKSRKIMVIAGAGTGKTEILTRRILSLIERDPQLSIKDMAIITFTNKATEELRSRLKQLFYQKWRSVQNPEEKLRFRYELEVLNSSQISTIHKFCHNLLQEFGPYHDQEVTMGPGFQVSGETLVRAVEAAVESYIAKKEKKKEEIAHLEDMPVHQFKAIITQTYQMIKTKGLNLDEVLTQTKRQSYFEDPQKLGKLKREIVDVLERVSQYHAQFKIRSLDTDDLIEYCAKILNNNPQFCQYVKQKYKYIFVDEFQDTSYYQAEMLKKICDESSDAPALFVVGDVKQSIYEFRGANLDSYSQVKSWIKREGKILNLSVNWRSTPELVQFVNQVFDKLKQNEMYEFRPEPLQPREIKKNVDLSEAYQWIRSNEDNHAELVADYLREELEKGNKPQDYAILVRKNYEIPALANALKAKSIPFQVVGSGNFFSQKEIIDTYKVLKYLYAPANPHHREEVVETIYFCDADRFDHFIIRLREKMNNDALTPAQILDLLYKNTAIYERLSTQEMANLNKLKAKARSITFNENINLKGFLNWLSVMIHSKPDEPLADVPEEQSRDGRVLIMTIHKAKGLQFTYVILPHLHHPVSRQALEPPMIYHPQKGLEFKYEKYYEKGTYIQSSGYDEAVKKNKFNTYSEELRVLYVALTRAKKKLILLGKENLSKEKICYQNWIDQAIHG